MKQEQHFSYPLDLAAFVRGRLTELHARAPALAALEEILEVAFFASMKTEESEPVLCTLAYVDMKNPDPMPPERIVADRWSYVRFEQPIPLDVKNLVKVSKSIDSAFAALAVCRDSNERLVIWGAIDQQGQRAAFTSRKADEGPESPGLLQRRRPDLSIALEGPQPQARALLSVSTVARGVSRPARLHSIEMPTAAQCNYWGEMPPNNSFQRTPSAN